MANKIKPILGTFLLGANAPNKDRQMFANLAIKKQVLSTAISVPHRRTNFIRQILGRFLLGANTPPSHGVHCSANLFIKKQTLTAAISNISAYSMSFEGIIHKQILSATVITTVPQYACLANLLIKKQTLVTNITNITTIDFTMSAALIIKKAVAAGHIIVRLPVKPQTAPTVEITWNTNETNMAMPVIWPDSVEVPIETVEINAAQSLANNISSAVEKTDIPESEAKVDIISRNIAESLLPEKVVDDEIFTNVAVDYVSKN